ncbi:MAG: hypothetical protein WB392_04185 [Methanotrichaceae archaeon]
MPRSALFGEGKFTGSALKARNSIGRSSWICRGMAKSLRGAPLMRRKHSVKYLGS